MAEIHVPLTNQPVAKTHMPAQHGSNHAASDSEYIASAIGGGALMLLGLRRAPAGLALALIGGALFYRGVSAMLSGSSSKTITVNRSITVNRQAEQLYDYWRDLDNLPRIMSHLEAVNEIDATRSHWVAKAPAGTTVEWDAEITEDIENSLISWRSLPGANIENSGTVRFQPTPGRGTEIHVSLCYEPPGGKLGQALAWLSGEEPGRQIADDLRRFKQMIETGQVTTTSGQPSARKPDTESDSEDARFDTNDDDEDNVRTASEESFPASDPPAWTKIKTAAGEEGER